MKHPREIIPMLEAAGFNLSKLDRVKIWAAWAKKNSSH